MESIEQTIRMNNLSKELQRYGFAQSSQDAIAQAGTVLGHETEHDSDAVQLSRSQVSEIINKMQRLWLFKENTDQKVSMVADQLVKVTDKLNEVIKTISLMEMNQAVFNKKLNVLREMGSSEPRQQSSQSQEHARESSPEKEKSAPIDRNGVSPEDVSIEKMFYCGNKR
ncbi:hypothetical protein JW711_02175 [Candidatus Woesearchaeota archaeon]|nr:hypothetical protein [Candidatus Woesearchaeota archaeon]